MPEQARYKSLIENLNDAVYTVDIKTLKFTSANSAAERLTGYTREELLKISVPQIIPKEHLALVKKMISLKKKKDRATVYEIEVVSKEGIRVPVEISSVAIYLNNEPFEILGVARDISERKLIEQQRNVFISLITHEIKNPLTTIIGFVGLFKKMEIIKADKKAISYVTTVLSQAEAIKNLMNDFLDASQMRVGKFKISRQLINLDDVIKEAASSFESIGKVKVTGSIRGKILADRSKILQVLNNLILNGFKYSEKERLVILVSENQKEIEVEVKDFGPGIPKEEQKNIFELFVRTEGSSNSKIPGHGVGLYICSEIIKLHKGRIWVESTLNKGSSFIFTLPKK